jgi:excisionase family DNA binding protein
VSMSDAQSTAFVAEIGRSVSIERAAQLLGVCRRTVYNRIKDGRLATLRTPWGSRRVLLASLHELQGTEQRVDPRWLEATQ